MALPKSNSPQNLSARRTSSNLIQPQMPPRLTLYAENVDITERADKSMRVDYFGRNKFSWSGSSLLDPRPVYKVAINAPEAGIVGSILLEGNLAPPHYSCGTDAAGAEERNIAGVAWANALPDASETVSLQIQEVAMSFKGYGYHDKTWVDRPFQEALQAAFWGHARLGPYAVVWWHSRAQDGTDISAEYLARWEDGRVITSRCVDSPKNTLGWGEGQIWPLVPGTPAPAGMSIRWDLGDAGVFVANITSTGIFADIPFWQAGRGPVTGGFEGQEVYTDQTGLWSLNQLPPFSSRAPEPAALPVVHVAVKLAVAVFTAWICLILARETSAAPTQPIIERVRMSSTLSLNMAMPGPMLTNISHSQFHSDKEQRPQRTEEQTPRLHHDGFSARSLSCDLSEWTMSVVPPPPEQGAPQSQPPRPQRILACVLCQQRKIKCDRRFPCANCIKNNTQCVPATKTRPRRRRFPERELLDRLQKYEDLLRRNNVKFDPLHKNPSLGEKESPGDCDESDEEQPQVGVADGSPSASVKSESTHEAKSIWQAMTQESRVPVDGTNILLSGVLESTVKGAWDQLPDDDLILFGSRAAAVDISTFHPEIVDIFRLWQTYLDNVNPLLKVTHTPSLQVRIIEAASDVKSIGTALEALMFSIYCMSIASLETAECQSMFGLSKENLLIKYHFGCQQALMNARFLQTTDRDCLTALYLYLLSVHGTVNPRSVCSVFGVAIRIAQCMGIHNESALVRCSIFEAEMRRRLWWSLMLYDTRRGEMADFKDSSLSPTWDCRVPLNVSDSDLRPEMGEQPLVTAKATEAIFVVVRGELADYVRQTPSHLDFTNPALKPIAKLPSSGGFVGLGKKVEQEYLKFCDTESPTHFMTIWSARGYLAKNQLLEHYSRFPGPDAHQTDDNRDAAMALAFRMLECDTMLMTSPLTKGYRWLLQCHFPFPAYIHVVQDLRRRPLSRQAERAWEVMSNNHEARFPLPGPVKTPLFRMFARTVLLAWEALEVAMKPEEPLTPPRIVLGIRQRMALIAKTEQATRTEECSGIANMSTSDFTMPTPMGLNDDNLMFDLGIQDSLAGIGLMDYTNVSEQDLINLGTNQFSWPSVGWDLE
ncbi:hypothetical protein AK830_g5689 [Neonectria ditissima]|uniref:Zn(2)-C6 fungal-type domain-containing protein n=1 Tax=Neonectria ditissima TaxID=78410 RepID=A0A0N8H758_9HYPO|nr:hypothetical protein AK830_g5689 [Neonectria ditissima]